MTKESPLVLLVDDDPDFLQMCGNLLEAAGYRVMRAVSAQEAREEINSRVPDMVITDLMMGRLLAGFELSQDIGRDSALSHLPVIVVSAIADREELHFHPTLEQQLKAFGVAAYFEKPVDPEELLARMRELLEGAASGGT
ncbi:MAG: response regulator [Candidatus Brocadiia bacterium]